MKNSIIILFLVTIALLITCKKEKGYNCVNGTCTATTKDPKYLTLSDCQNICAGGGATPTPTATPTNTTGTLKITIFHPQTDCPPQVNAVVHTVGIGLSSTDISNDSFLKSFTGTNPGKSYTFTLSPGLYYYKGKACCTNCNSQGCTNWAGFTGVGSCLSKSGSVQIEAGKEVSRQVSL